MSFSFNVRAATIAAAAALATAEMDKVVEQQPGHAADRDAVLATIDTYAKMLTDDESRDIAISASGSLGGDYQDGAFTRISGATIGVNVLAVYRPASPQ